MLNIAIFTGGPSAERGIAIKSAGLVEKYLDRSKYIHRVIHVEDNGWFDRETGVALNMNDCSLSIDGNNIRFDFAFLVIHGTPVEDGKMQGYFEMLKIPYSTCDTLTCALTFNKQWCKDMLMAYDVPMAVSKVVRSEATAQFDAKSIKYPVFVKPNNNGSSYGVSRVDNPDKLPEALANAAIYDTEIMIEEYMRGREFSCGVVRKDSEIHVFPVTEIIPKGEFFDYEAKYLGASQEITPAEISDVLAEQCKNRSRDLYTLLKCRGMVRFDFILQENTFKLLEVNTVPGLSEASIIPQQARAYGWSVAELLEAVIEDAIAAT